MAAAQSPLRRWRRAGHRRSDVADLRLSSRVGDDFVFTPEGSAPIRLRIVGTLADSVLQSELIIGEHDFVRLFPQHEGYRVWMIEAPEAAAARSHDAPRRSAVGFRRRRHRYAGAARRLSPGREHVSLDVSGARRARAAARHARTRGRARRTDRQRQSVCRPDRRRALRDAAQSAAAARPENRSQVSHDQTNCDCHGVHRRGILRGPCDDRPDAECGAGDRSTAGRSAGKRRGPGAADSARPGCAGRIARPDGHRPARDRQRDEHLIHEHRPPPGIPVWKRPVLPFLRSARLSTANNANRVSARASSCRRTATC